MGTITREMNGEKRKVAEHKDKLGRDVRGITKLKR